MEYGLQRGRFYLVPPRDGDVEWMIACFDDEEIWSMFGFDEPATAEMRRRVDTGELVIGVLHRLQDRRRIGFTVCFPPKDHLGIWEFGFAIPDRADRDAFAAIASCDLTGHYMFDHLRIEAGSFRIRMDNRASYAVTRRMGYRPYGRWRVGEHVFRFYRLNAEIWGRRRDALDRAEAERPSGLGATFLTLLDPPFEPEPLD